MKYEYPPSKHIQSYAPFDEASHFLCDGQIEFDTITVDCEFEVVYTHNCEIIVILYLPQNMILELFWNKTEKGSYALGGIIPNNHFKQLTGIDKFFRHSIIIKDGFFRNLGGTNAPTTFVANSLQVTDRRDFEVENYEYMSDYIFELTGIDFDTDFLHQLQFPTNTDGSPIILEAIGKRIRKYDNQPLARLRLPKDILINGWTPEDFIDLWCALVSLAIGRDVRWIQMEYISERQVIYTWRYRNNVLGLSNFTGLISKYPLNFDSASTIKFIKECFKPIQTGNISSTLASQYTLAIRHYVSYRLMNYRKEDHARLVGTTVEELLTSWESDQNLKHEPIVTDEELTRILEVAKSEVYPIIKTFDGSAKRKNKIKNKVKYLLRNELSRFGFQDRLDRYFSSETHGLSADWYKNNISNRLLHFIATRDKVVHIGELPSDKIKENWWYYYNLLMILPLMVFAFFRYDGQYVDLTEYWKDGIQAPPSEEQDR